MPKVIDYICIGATCTSDLTDRVNALVIKGWQPFGGVATNAVPAVEGNHDASDYFVQALVLYNE